MKYKLESYAGVSSRYQCPQCGDKHSFAYYVDEQGNILDSTVGRCNHEAGCGYHYTPREWFADHPQDRQGAKQNLLWKNVKQSPKPQPQPSYIPWKYVERCASYNSTLVEFLCGLFNEATITRVVEDYAIGCTKDRSVIYWQIDCFGRVRTGKTILYNPYTGHRVKEKGVNWVHSLLARNGVIKDYNLMQCLFGEHLLKLYPDKIVAVVEAEKTAVICAAVYPQYVWLATGGRSQMSVEKFKPLTGRKVILFPDTDTTGDTYWQWLAKSREYTFVKSIVVSDILERYATDEERESKIDIADLLVKELGDQGDQHTINKEMSDQERILAQMVEDNPCIGLLKDRLNLELVC